MHMRPVGKAAPALSEQVAGDVSASCGCDVELCDVDTVMSGVVSVGLCDLDMLSGVGDTGVSGVDTLVSATVSGSLCDIDRVTGGVDTLVSATVDGCLCDIDSVSGDVAQCCRVLSVAVCVTLTGCHEVT